MPKLLFTFLLGITVFIFAFNAPAGADLANGQQIFTANCSACHIGGSNVIIASKTLRKEALEKYEMNSLEAITNQITYGKNAMPSFKSRLTPEEIKAVAAYVLGQSETGW